MIFPINCIIHSIFFKVSSTTLYFRLHDTKIAMWSVLLSETHQTQLGLDLQCLFSAYTWRKSTINVKHSKINVSSVTKLNEIPYCYTSLTMWLIWTSVYRCRSAQIYYLCQYSPIVAYCQVDCVVFLFWHNFVWICLLKCKKKKLNSVFLSCLRRANN